MDILTKALQIILGTLVAIIALFLGKMVWIYFAFCISTPLVLWFGPVMIGYIWITINLFRLKKWALLIFLITIILAGIMEILFIYHMAPKENFIESFRFSIFLVSTVIIPIFGIAAFIRKIRKS